MQPPKIILQTNTHFCNFYCKILQYSLDNLSVRMERRIAAAPPGILRAFMITTDKSTDRRLKRENQNKDAHGFETKDQLSRWFSGNVERTVASHLGNGVQLGVSTGMAMQGLEPYATWVKLPPQTLIKPFNQPQGIKIAVVGGGVQTTWFVTDFRLGRGVLVDEWR